MWYIIITKKEKGAFINMKGITKFLLSVAAVIAAMAAITAIVYKITKKRLKINVDVLPEDIEDENELTAAVDIVDFELPDEDEDK